MTITKMESKEQRLERKLSDNWDNVEVKKIYWDVYNYPLLFLSNNVLEESFEYRITCTLSDDDYTGFNEDAYIRDDTLFIVNNNLDILLHYLVSMQDKLKTKWLDFEKNNLINQP